jgi:hypothetical protein
MPPHHQADPAEHDMETSVERRGDVITVLKVCRTVDDAVASFGT